MSKKIIGNTVGTTISLASVEKRIKPIKTINGAFADENGNIQIEGGIGVDGQTPFIGENGNWWIGVIDTGVKAQGNKGDKGDAPVKGEDYWTQDDVEEIYSYLDDAVKDAYKKGTSIPSGSDLNDYRTIGKYYASANSIAASLENCPTTQNFVMWVFIRTDSVPSQLILDLTGKLFIRSRTSSTWRTWQTYLTDANVTKIVQEELAKYSQVRPEFVDDVAACTDESKLYVLQSTGTIHAYMAHTEYPFTNQISLSINADGTEYVGENGEDGYKRGYRLNSSGVEAENPKQNVTGFMPAKDGDTIYFKNVNYIPGVEGAYIAIYDSEFNCISSMQSQGLTGGSNYYISSYTVDEATGCITSATLYEKYPVGIAYVRVSAIDLDSASIITVNEEIVDEPTIIHRWTDTGYAFVPADYEPRVIKAENDIAALKQAIAGDIAVYGMVDSENNIIMTGTLAVGKYTLKYMDEDGTTREIGEFTME